MTIRSAQPKDIPALLGLLEQILPFTTKPVPIFSKKRWQI